MLSEIRHSCGLNFRIEIDGGVHRDTVSDIVRAGAEILVTGSAIFDQGDPRESVRQLLESAQGAPNR